jgi:ferric-dicitrate binding protein FerR (iron transport regulator)
MENAAIERIWVLISLKLSNEANIAEMMELQSLLQQHPEEAYALEVMQDIWNKPVKENNQYAEYQYKELTQKMQKMGIHTTGFHGQDEHLLSVQNDIELIKKGWLTTKKILALSFSLITVTVLSWIFLYNPIPVQSIVKSSVITTKDGSKTSVVLPDGTKVWVNAGSKLTYDNNYGSKLREVSLLGEAFFDVVKNPEKPFIIHTSKMDIKVLGTAFNVRCYPNEKKTETSLIRGRIEVTLKDRPNEKIYLSPNEKLTLLNDNIIPSESRFPKKIVHHVAEPIEPLVSIGHITHTLTDSAIVETSWVENKLEFRSEAFEEVASKMERWYGVKIDIEDDHLKQEHLTGSFETETVDQALSALQYTTKFKFSINKNLITITK